MTEPSAFWRKRFRQDFSEMPYRISFTRKIGDKSEFGYANPEIMHGWWSRDSVENDDGTWTLTIYFTDKKDLMICRLMTDE